MDPISAAASISSVCFASAKLLGSFLEYIHDIKEVPGNVEALAAELSALNLHLSV
jgi:hypothetical protein